MIIAGGERMRLIVAAPVLVMAGVTACQVDWGGGSISLENPAPPPDSSAATLERTQIPLQPGPYLFIAALDRSGGAVVTPVARLGGEPGAVEFSDVAIPSTDDPTYRARFDSVVFASGRELELLTGGERIGSLVLDGLADGTVGACGSVARARSMIVPGESTPAVAFAVPSASGAVTVPRRTATPGATSSMQVAGPVLAERLIGGDRAFLAQRVAMAPVRLEGDTLPGMTATYLIADSLAAGPPGNEAVSLFFMARFEPTEGYVPVWQEVRRYGTGDKEAFAHLDWMRIDGQRVDVVRRFDDSSERLALSATPADGERSVSWVEPPGCAALQRVGIR
jgi:hypothetical protein